MSISLVVDGKPYNNFSKMVVDKSIDTFTGAFNFDVVDSDESGLQSSIAFPIKVGSTCTVLVNEEPVITGYVDSISGSYAANAHMLSVKGRDLTSDLVDSRVGGNLNFSSDISLTEIIERTIAHLKIRDLQVKNLVPDLAPFSKEDLDTISVKPSKTAFEFIEMYARKRQVLITTDNLGTVIITRNFSDRLDGSIINETGNSNNTVLSGRFKYDNSKRYHTYILRSQQNPVALVTTVANDGTTSGAQTTASAMSDQSGNATDNEIRIGRVYEKISESSTTQKVLHDRAIWEGNIRKCRALTYTPTVQGFTANEEGDIWELNKLIKVSDFFAKIDALMLINRITFKLDLQSGSTTTLELVNKDAYTLSLQFSKKDKKANKIAPNIILVPNQ